MRIAVIDDESRSGACLSDGTTAEGFRQKPVQTQSECPYEHARGRNAQSVHVEFLLLSNTPNDVENRSKTVNSATNQVVSIPVGKGDAQQYNYILIKNTLCRYDYRILRQITNPLSVFGFEDPVMSGRAISTYTFFNRHFTRFRQAMEPNLVSEMMSDSMWSGLADRLRMMMY